MSGRSEVLSPEERCERVRMALAEAGYPRAHVVFGTGRRTGAPGVMVWGQFGRVPSSAIWRAGMATREIHTCWPCYSVDFSEDPNCDHDPLTSPWPEVPR